MKTIVDTGMYNNSQPSTNKYYQFVFRNALFMIKTRLVVLQQQ